MSNALGGVCDRWRRSPTRNPTTGRRITAAGQVYKKLEEQCSNSLSTTVRISRAPVLAPAPIVRSKYFSKTVSLTDRASSVVVHPLNARVQTTSYLAALKSAASFLRRTAKPYSPSLFRVDHVLGKGAFGQVALVTNEDTGKQLVLKKLAKKSDSKRQLSEHGRTSWGAIVNEVSILRRLEPYCSTYLVCYDGFFEDDKHYYVTMKYAGAEMTSLGEWIKSQGRTGASAAVLNNIIENLIEGLKVIHGQSIAHRDIKPDNILVNPVTGAIRYLDFGLACQGEGCENVGLSGTRGYAAPEVWLAHPGTRFSLEQLQAADIWSLGITIYALLDGRNPFYWIEQLDRSYQTHMDQGYTLRTPNDILRTFVYLDPRSTILNHTIEVERLLRNELDAPIISLSDLLSPNITIRTIALQDAVLE